jgi:hypothetical protein
MKKHFVVILEQCSATFQIESKIIIFKWIWTSYFTFLWHVGRKEDDLCNNFEPIKSRFWFSSTVGLVSAKLHGHGDCIHLRGNAVAMGHQVSDTQQMNLCCKRVGYTHTLSESFMTPVKKLNVIQCSRNKLFSFHLCIAEHGNLRTLVPF